MRADRIPVGEPKAPSGAPECPPGLDADEQAGWDTFTAAVERLGLLSPVDASNAEIFARAYGVAAKLGADIRARGVTVEGSHGGMVVNPSIDARAKQQRLMISILSLYGLSPSDRSRLRATDQAEVDPLDAFKKEFA
jgi:P27 family predicted phage terminase small subunit